MDGANRETEDAEQQVTNECAAAIAAATGKEPASAAAPGPPPPPPPQPTPALHSTMPQETAAPFPRTWGVCRVRGGKVLYLHVQVGGLCAAHSNTAAAHHHHAPQPRRVLASVVRLEALVLGVYWAGQKVRGLRVLVALHGCPWGAPEVAAGWRRAPASIPQAPIKRNHN